MNGLDALRQVADTVMYEGYVLYPYRASAPKNRSRWQFGVLMPQDFAAADPGESSAAQTECVIEAGRTPSLRVILRFLQVQRRTIEFDDAWRGACEEFARAQGCDVTTAPWDEAVAHEIAFEAGCGGEATFEVDGGEYVTHVSFSGRAVRRREALAVHVAVTTEDLPGPWGAKRVRISVANRTAGCGRASDRAAALPFAPVAVHCLVQARDARFVSMVDPPEWAAAHVAQCRNTGMWPVLGASPDLLLSAPIILYDDPRVAPESPGDLFDATEIDEILTLRTLALTDAEKAEARATDPRAAALIDRTEALDAAALGRLHGTMRMVAAGEAVVPHPAPPAPASQGPAVSSAPSARPAEPPVFGDDPYAELFDAPPGASTVVVAGTAIRAGSTVRLRPGSRRADAQDMFLADRLAVVEAVLRDVEDRAYLAVSLQDDPGRDLKRSHGRFLYFAPDEVEPLPEDAS